MKITQDKLDKAKALAETHGKKSGKIILDLVTEVERLRRMTLRKGTHPVSETDPWPYNPHLGTQICDLDDEFLKAWVDARSRAALNFDVAYAVVAERDLALYDLIVKHLKTNGIKTKDPTASIPQTTP